MPFPNEHAARQRPPEGFARMRRTHPSGWPEGIDALLGIRHDGTSVIQSIRAKTDRWTAERFRDWLKTHGFKSKVEEAVKKHLPRGFWEGVV